jgi:hypothetical protein
MSGAALQNLAGSEEQQRRAARRAMGFPEIEPEVRATPSVLRYENRMTLTPFHGHEDPGRYSVFHNCSMPVLNTTGQMKYNQGETWTHWRGETRPVSYYQYCMDGMKAANQISLDKRSIFSSATNVSKVEASSLSSWLFDHWTDVFFIQENGLVVVVIRVQQMIQQRLQTALIVEKQRANNQKPMNYFIFNRIKDTGFDFETDEQYCDIIDSIMQNTVMVVNGISPRVKGRVLVIKGVQDTTMNFRFDDYLEYHWVPDGVGEGFKP